MCCSPLLYTCAVAAPLLERKRWRHIEGHHGLCWWQFASLCLAQALARARGGQQLLAALAAAMVLLAAARLGGGAAPVSFATIGPAAAAAGALAFSRLLALAEKKLTLADYDHARH